jgi:hypothetical protein
MVQVESYCEEEASTFVAELDEIVEGDGYVGVDWVIAHVEYGVSMLKGFGDDDDFVLIVVCA